MRATIAKLISTGIIIVNKITSFIKLCSLGILLCELLNGLIPFIDQPATLIMLEKETLTRILKFDALNLEFISAKYFLSKK